MMFPIFEWEIRAVELAKSLPHAGPLYWFMSFLSDFSQSKWLVFLAAGFWIWQNGWRSVFNTMISVVIAVGI
ncbi:hypothetical protein, partial [Shewanella algae]|uniref:hypothetical protein n=1 Tax=Shewanella algae TaxID=38313 RepID=UPI00313D12B2